jgi:hypothetical protein
MGTGEKAHRMLCAKELLTSPSELVVRSVWSQEDCGSAERFGADVFG